MQNSYVFKFMDSYNYYIKNRVGNNITTLDEVESIDSDFISEKIYNFYNIFLKFKLQFIKGLHSKDPKFTSLSLSKYNMYEHFREHLMKYHNTCCILKNYKSNAFYDEFKLYSKGKHEEAFNYLGFDNEFYKILNINILNHGEISEDSYYLYENVTIYEMIDGTGFSLSYDCDDEEIKFNTKKSIDASNKWNSNESIKEQSIRIFQEMNINLDLIKDIMKKPENQKFRLVMNFITSSKESAFVEKDVNTLMNVYLINKEENPIDKVGHLYDEFVRNIEADYTYKNAELYEKISTINKECSGNYVKLMNSAQFVDFLINNSVGTLVLPRCLNTHITDVSELKSFSSMLPYTIKGISIHKSNIIYDLESDAYIQACSFKPNMSIHINGVVEDDNFLSNNYNIFIFWIKYKIKINTKYHDNPEQQLITQEKINSDFIKFYGDKYVMIFDMLNVKLREYCAVLWKCYKENKISRPSVMKENEFPVCIKTDDINSNNNLVYYIHRNHYRPKKTENNRFSINIDYIYSEFMIKDVLFKFLNYANRPQHCIYGNMFYKIVDIDMSPSIKLTSSFITDPLLSIE